MDCASYITQLLRDPAMTVDTEWLNSTMREHPAFILPLLLVLKRQPKLLDKDTLERVQSVAVLNCADPLALADFVDPTSQGWAAFYPPAQVHQASTDEAIVDFLNTFGQSSTPEEDAMLERLLFSPVPADYFSGTDEPFDPSDPLALPPELMPAEMRAQAPAAPETPAESTARQPARPSANTATPAAASQRPNARPAHEETLLSESLAKIFIKQGRYERAFEIISKLSLKYPEKSIYFADQLRFLQKLMINQKFLYK